MRTVVLTIAALVAFAANSVICRLALGEGSIDAASFTLVRIAAGALALGVLTIGRGQRPAGRWGSAFALALYAVPFSFAYVSLEAGTGALILFAAVHLVMIGVGLTLGERPRAAEWLGMLVALCGLVWLVAPGVTAPPLLGATLMAIAGAAWGVYSLRGRATTAPVARTAGNFLLAVPVVAVAVAFALPAAHWTGRGVLLATISGALASGLGYVIWYAALPGLTATRAATVQLAVPLLAAFGGVALLGEAITVRLATAAALILSGVGMAIRGRRRR